MKYEIYHETLGSAVQEVQRFMDKKKIECEEIINHFWEAVGYEETVNASFEIDSIKGKNTQKGLHMNFYRFPSGRYELSIYVLW